MMMYEWSSTGNCAASMCYSLIPFLQQQQQSYYDERVSFFPCFSLSVSFAKVFRFVRAKSCNIQVALSMIHLKPILSLDKHERFLTVVAGGNDPKKLAVNILERL
jgi:hypothetical protein